MGRLRGVGIVAVVALIAAPAIALADSPKKPAAGAWVPYLPTPADGTEAIASFTVTSNGTGITSLTFGVTSQAESRPKCPTGSVSVTGPLGMKLYKGLYRSSPFWAFGRVVTKPYIGVGRVRVFADAPVTATLDGQPLKGAMFGMEFGPADTEGVKGDSGLGEFDFSAKCQVSLNETVSQAENSGNPGVTGT
jgi:hypothetical protein